MLMLVFPRSHILARQGRSTKVGNLVGKLEFSDDQLQQTQRGLDAAGVAMPSFGGLGKALAKEMNEEPEPEPESEEDRESTQSRCDMESALLTMRLFPQASSVSWAKTQPTSWASSLPVVESWLAALPPSANVSLKKLEDASARRQSADARKLKRPRGSASKRNDDARLRKRQQQQQRQRRQKQQGKEQRKNVAAEMRSSSPPWPPRSKLPCEAPSYASASFNESPSLTGMSDPSLRYSLKFEGSWLERLTSNSSPTLQAPPRTSSSCRQRYDRHWLGDSSLPGFRR